MKDDHIAYLPYAWPRCTTVKIHWYRHAMRQIENFDFDPQNKLGSAALLARFRLARCGSNKWMLKRKKFKAGLMFKTLKGNTTYLPIYKIFFQFVALGFEMKLSKPVHAELIN